MHRLVLGCRGKARPIRAEGDVIYLMGVTGEGEQFLAGTGVPDLRRPIRTSRGQAFSVRAEGAAIDPIRMTGEGEQFLAGTGVLHSRRAIRAGVARRVILPRLEGFRS